MSPWSRMIALAVGGAIGANLRYWLGLWVAGWAGTKFPWATLLINVSGAFALGFLASAVDRRCPDPNRAAEAIVLLVLVGLLGGYTTFSTFALESARLWRQTLIVSSLAYMAGSVAAGFSGCLLGIALARLLVPPSS